MDKPSKTVGRKKGSAKSGGRQKGTPNKMTVAVKDALSAAFDDMGGVTALVEWGQENPTEFYKIWAKLLPQQIKADIKTETEQKPQVIFYWPDNGRDPKNPKPIMDGTVNGSTKRGTKMSQLNDVPTCD